MNPKQTIVGYLLKHPCSKLVALNCIGLPLSPAEVWGVVQELLASGEIKGMGYSSHVEEYYVSGGAEFMSNENLGKYKMGDDK